MLIGELNFQPLHFQRDSAANVFAINLANANIQQIYQ